MTSICRHAIVKHAAAEMYQLVADIELYPEFLTWCASTHILNRSDEQVEARIDIAYKGINKSFTTRNYLQKGKSMEMRLVSGPFKNLQGFWRFKALDDTACKVSLDLEFEFSNKLVAITMGKVFNEIAASLVDSFCRRADQIYNHEHSE
ncbi:MAG: type II toxin-antitoxin system RatA family toxin [Acidiferrobacterales bacterium]